MSTSQVPDLSFEDLERQFDARLGVYAIDVAAGGSILADYRGFERFAFCSTFKVYAAAAVLAAVDRGTVALTDTRTVTEADKVPDSAVDWTAGSTPTLADLCAAALAKSDNTAGNLLITEAGGTEGLTAFARSVGDTEFRLDRTEPELNTAIPGDERDTTTPSSMAAGYGELLDGDTLSDASKQQLQKWMTATETSDKRFRAGVPAGWTTADKTGTGSYGVSNDAGLLLGPEGQRILLIVLNTTTSGNSESPAVNEMVAEVTKVVVAAQ